MLLPLILAACGGGEDAATVASASRARLTASRPDTLVVVRYDFDQDDHVDVLTLDVSQRPCRIVDALEGRDHGVFVDAGARWGGRPVDAGLDEALRAYLERSFAVAHETLLEVQVRGRPILLSVIE